MKSTNDDMNAREWFDTLPDYAREEIKSMSLRVALEHVELAIDELEVIAEGLRYDIAEEERRDNPDET